MPNEIETMVRQFRSRAAKMQLTRDQRIKARMVENDLWLLLAADTPEIRAAAMRSIENFELAMAE